MARNTHQPPEKTIESILAEENARFLAPKPAIREPSNFIPNMDKAQLASLALEKLSEALQAIDATLQPQLAKNISEAVLDRCEGKPGQAITLDANIRTVTVNANIEFVQPNRERLVGQGVDNALVIDNATQK